MEASQSEVEAPPMAPPVDEPFPEEAHAREALPPMEPAPVEEPLQAEAPIRPRAETPVAFATPEEEPTEPEAPRSSRSHGSLVGRDDSSYPPVDLDNHFFEGLRQSRPSYPPEDAEERDPRMALKLTPEMAQRRAQLQKYVKVAVAAASAVCLAALVKVAVAHSATDAGASRPVTSTAAAAPPKSVVVLPVVPAAETHAAPTPPAPPPAETQAAPAPPVPAPAAAPPKPDETAAPAAAAPADPAAQTAASTETKELDPKAAAKEKNTARTLLERGKMADAIEAGERSVALDPTDAEAWLILGASYQEKGDMKNARRSYKACLEQGKRGPKYECAAMPH